jgi:hypothetical protein
MKNIEISDMIAWWISKMPEGREGHFDTQLYAKILQVKSEWKAKG